MAGVGRPPPPITLVVPGREAPAELLAVAPPSRPLLPARLRPLLLAVAATLGAGVLVAIDQQAAARPALVPVEASPPFSASAPPWAWWRSTR